MYIKIKRDPDARAATEQTGAEYSLIDSTELLTNLTLHDREVLHDDATFALYRYLTSGRAPNGSMDLSRLDGFLTAVMASRDGVPVLDWMPVVWGGGEPEFEDMAEAETALAAITRRCRQIDKDLHVTGCLVTILRRTAEGEVSAGAWCRGFMQGVMLTPEQWKEVFHHKLGQTVLLPIAAIAADERALGLFHPVKERAVERAPDLVVALEHPFWASELPDVWADLRACAAPDVSTTEVLPVRDDAGSNAIPAPAMSSDHSNETSKLRQKIFGRAK